MRRKQILLYDYFAQWIEVYKDGAVRAYIREILAIISALKKRLPQNLN